MEPLTYYVPYEKFSKIYYAYPPIFAFFCWGGLPVTDWLILTTVGCLLGIWASNVGYRKIVRHRTSLTVTDTALETYTLAGVLQSIPFTELLGPFEDKLGPMKRFKYMSSKDESGNDTRKLIIVTSFTENFDELIALLAQKVKDAQG